LSSYVNTGFAGAFPRGLARALCTRREPCGLFPGLGSYSVPLRGTSEGEAGVHACGSWRDAGGGGGYPRGWQTVSPFVGLGIYSVPLCGTREGEAPVALLPEGAT
jgi:hypothetical protein